VIEDKEKRLGQNLKIKISKNNLFLNIHQVSTNSKNQYKKKIQLLKIFKKPKINTSKRNKKKKIYKLKKNKNVVLIK